MASADFFHDTSTPLAPGLCKSPYNIYQIPMAISATAISYDCKNKWLSGLYLSVVLTIFKRLPATELLSTAFYPAPLHWDRGL